MIAMSCVWGARTISLEENRTILSTWLKTSFEGNRHSLRIKRFDELGEGQFLNTSLVT